jgi:hypothetical protein
MGANHTLQLTNANFIALHLLFALLFSASARLPQQAINPPPTAFPSLSAPRTPLVSEPTTRVRSALLAVIRLLALPLASFVQQASTLTRPPMRAVFAPKTPSLFQAQQIEKAALRARMLVSSPNLVLATVRSALNMRSTMNSRRLLATACRPSPE